MKKIDIVNNSYQTRNGKKVTIHEHHSDCTYKYYGTIEENGAYHLCRWDEYGVSDVKTIEHNLVEIPKTVTIAFLKYENGSIVTMLWDAATEEAKKRWRESLFFLGLSTCTLPVKE